MTLTLCPVRRHQREDEAFFFSLLGLDIDAYLGWPAASGAPETAACSQDGPKCLLESRKGA